MASSKTATPEQLRTFLRHRGKDFLADPNITSVGIGYKIREGRRTETVAVQFTVEAKVDEGDIERLGSTPIPETVLVERIEVPTDVVERTFAPGYTVVEEAEAPERVRRVDPVVPGVSVAHVSVSAGTLGCIVYDRADATPYLLSNWHVLHGPEGKIGDDVVQPGPHDDNRVARNRVGALARSHLGTAGDCAVATIEDRRFDPSVLELDVVPDRIGDAALGDKVVKSGRTSGVTHGVVSRVDVLVKLDYGEAGVQQIGGFEIEPDPQRPAPGDEISEGGDSGAVWLFKARNGRPGTVLAGLHFGGEADGAAGEHALACVPRSVFEKLGITLSRESAETLRAEQAAQGGYDAAFLSTKVPLPELSPDAAADALEVDGDTTVAYTHFSLSMSKERRLARWVGWNVDGGELQRIDRSSMEFHLDPRLPEKAQVGDELYADNRIDRGHLARRSDLLWGPRTEAEQANEDSFSFTNIAPQVDDFNQSSRQGVWGRLEDALFEDVEVQDLRISVFAGPVFGSDDQTYREVKLPREYWKVIAYVEGSRLRARGFLLSQSLDGLETLDLDEFRTWQVPLADITERTGVRFGPVLADAESEVLESLDRQPLGSPADIRW